VGASLRLVRPEPEIPHSPEQVVALKEEIRALRQEVHLLRRRDEMVHFYLHRLDEEMRLAAQLQRDFLPTELPCVGAAKFEVLFRPAGYVSGDLYDVFRLDETRVGFYLVDAIGHGVPAALLTMFLRTSLVSKEILPGGYRILTPGETMTKLNTAMAGQSFSQTTFATAIYGVVDCVSGELSLSRAGHPMPILLPAGEEEPSELAADGGGLLGVFPEGVFPTVTLKMRPGDRLFVYSDGVEFLFSGNSDNPAATWQRELHGKRGMPTGQILSDFNERMDHLEGSLEPKDDLTIITVEFR
jgi:sigma-B regulation protein RsbU (phosphoserine phosphatase)